jgi:hypothetical protein
MMMNSTRGQMTLVQLNKHEINKTLFINMSFYLMLSSDGCKETFMNNHGGDFTVQLDKTLDMRGESWEVALVDMIYTGQAFPNLPVEDVEITLKVEGKPQYENQYFITYDQTMDLRLTLKKIHRVEVIL